MTDDSRRSRGWPRVTIRDVAQAANVSDATVSRVLTGTTFVAEETRTAVLEAIQRTGYIRNNAARQLAGHDSDVVGLLIRDTRNPYYGRVNSELQFHSSERGLHMLTVTRGHPQRAEADVAGVQHLLEQRVRGIFVASGVTPLDQLTPMSQFVPIVVIGRIVEAGDIHSIAYDEEATGHLAADELIERGHYDVAVVLPPAEVSAVENIRATAMIQRLREAGRRPVIIPAPTAGVRDEGIAEILELTRTRQITAAMFASDQRVLAFLTAAQAGGVVVPEDVSITGVDGVLPGIDLLGLSTVRLPIESVTQRAVEVLAAHLAAKGKVEAVREIHPATFMTGRMLRTLR